MKFLCIKVLLSGATLALAISTNQLVVVEQPSPDASPIYGVTIPPGYRDWQMIAPAAEAAPLQRVNR